MNKNIFGVTVPDDHIKKLEESIVDGDPKSQISKEHQQHVGMEMTKDLVDYIKTTPLKGIHLMAIGQESILDKIIKSLS